MKETIERKHLALLINIIRKDAYVLILRFQSTENPNLPFMAKKRGLNIIRINPKVNKRGLYSIV